MELRFQPYFKFYTERSKAVHHESAEEVQHLSLAEYFKLFKEVSPCPGS